MTRRNKIFMISSICVIAAAIITIAFVLLLNAIAPKTFSSAKEECEKILANNHGKMEELAVESLKSEKNISGHYLDYYYSSYGEEGYVTFDIGSQGMLGGQYWELVYSENGNFGQESEVYLYEEPDGNNIIKGEKLDEHWWFVWTDYDGTDRSYQ